MCGCMKNKNPRALSARATTQSQPIITASVRKAPTPISVQSVGKTPVPVTPSIPKEQKGMSPEQLERAKKRREIMFKKLGR